MIVVVLNVSTNEEDMISPEESLASDEIEKKALDKIKQICGAGKFSQFTYD